MNLPSFLMSRWITSRGAAHSWRMIGTFGSSADNLPRPRRRRIKPAGERAILKA